MRPDVKKLTHVELVEALRQALSFVEALKLAISYGDFGKQFEPAHRKAIEVAAELADEFAIRLP